MKFTINPLTQQELKILKKEVKSAYITGILAGIMISIVFIMLSIIVTDKIGQKEFYIISAIITGSIFITSLMVRNLLSDINKGIKHLYEYKILEKISYLDNEPGIGGVKMKFYLYTDSKKFSVTEHMYTEAKINDLIIEHEAPKSNVSFQVEIII